MLGGPSRFLCIFHLLLFPCFTFFSNSTLAFTFSSDSYRICFRVEYNNPKHQLLELNVFPRRSVFVQISLHNFAGSVLTRENSAEWFHSSFTNRQFRWHFQKIEPVPNVYIFDEIVTKCSVIHKRMRSVKVEHTYASVLLFRWLFIL